MHRMRAYVETLVQHEESEPDGASPPAIAAANGVVYWSANKDRVAPHLLALERGGFPVYNYFYWVHRIRQFAHGIWFRTWTIDASS